MNMVECLNAFIAVLLRKNASFVFGLLLGIGALRDSFDHIVKVFKEDLLTLVAYRCFEFWSGVRAVSIKPSNGCLLRTLSRIILRS